VLLVLFISKTQYPKWLDWHLMLQLIGFLFSISGFCTVFFYGELSNHINTLHSISGIVCIILSSLVQPHFGLPDQDAVIQDKKLSWKRHSVLGRLTLILAYVTLSLGLILLKVSDIIIMLFSCWTATVLGLVFWVSFKRILWTNSKTP